MPAHCLTTGAGVTPNCQALSLCYSLRGFFGGWGWQSDQMPVHSLSAAAAVALVCVVIFPSLQGRSYFGGMPPEWDMLDGADPQKNARAGCMVLARSVGSVTAGFHKYPAI